MAKKLKKLKNLFPTLFLAKTGWDRPRKWKKKIYFRIPFILDRGKKIPKKIAKKLKKFKNLFPTLFFAKTGWDRPRKRKKILLPNSILTQPDLENSKKNSKKIQKIKKLNSGIISMQKGLREAEKEKKKI